MIAAISNQLKNPAIFLSLVNVFCAIIGFLKGVYVIRQLGAEWLGVLAILTGFVNMVANFVDLRLTDIAAKLYYAVPVGDGSAAEKRAIIQAGLVLQTGLALALFLLATVSMALFLPFFTAKAVSFSWILAIAVGEAILYMTALLTFVQRFTEKFHPLGILQIINSFTTAIIFCAFLYINPTLGGYAIATIVAALTTLLISITGTAAMWRKAQGNALFRGIRQICFTGYAKSLRFIFWSNILGYAKLLHRAADVLVVGWLFNDRETGLYKLARQLTDTLYIIYDAMNKIYQPSFLSVLAEGNRDKFTAKARKLTLYTAAATVLLAVVEGFGLHSVINALFSADFTGAGTATIILSLPVFFVIGLSLWVWPLLVHYGRIGPFTLHSLVAVCIGQYGVPLALTGYFGHPRIEWFALGYLCFYVLLYSLTCLDLARNYSAYLPFGSSASKASNI